MPWQLTPYTIPLALATVISAAVGVYGFYRYREDSSALSAGFVLTMLGASIWAGLYLLQISAPTLEAKLTLGHLNVGKDLAILGFLTFVLAYTDNHRFLRPRYLALYLAWPVAFYGVIRPTWQFHDFYLNAPRVVPMEGSVRLISDLGVANTVDALWSYGIMAVGMVVVAWFAYRRRGVYRWQAGLVLVAAFVPTALNVPLMLAGWGIVPGIWPWAFNPSPVAMSVTGLLLAVAISKYRFLDLVPIARDRVVETMRDGYVVLDEHDRVVDLNRAARQLLEFEGDPIGARVDELLPDGEVVDRRETGERLQGAMEIGEGESTRYVEIEVSPLSEGEQFIGRLVTLRDVTERRSVEKRYRALIENSSDLITVVDEDGTIQYQSPSARRILGYRPEEMTGEPVFSFVHPEDRETIREQFENVVEQDADFERTELRVETAVGDHRTVEAVGRNLLDEPFVEGLVINSRDVSMRKEREEELRRKNERLDQFASVVSHDLRNPLGVAKGRSDLALEADDPESHLEIVQRSLDRMEAIIDDVLTLARQGEEVGELGHVDLASVARNAWANVDTPEAELTVAASRELSADPDRLLQLFENLYRNAVEHGGEDVTVVVGPTADGFYVADDGRGIPPEERETVFESGFTTATDGTGFGLAIVERIADAHGWSVRAGESADGGARFDVTGLETIDLPGAAGPEPETANDD